MIIPTTTYDNSLYILRGDLIQGGAKMPALLKYLPRLNHNHFAYVGSVYGSGAWAVAEACAHLNYKCTLWMAKSNDAPLWLSKIQETGAILNWCDPLPVATLHQKVSTEYPDLYNLPLGFDTPDFIEDMASIICDSITSQPRPTQIWVPALSGVVARSACLAFPDAQIHAVSAAKNHGDIGRAILHTAPEKYHKPAITLPPYPACPFSDAKIWQFAEKTAISGAYILNVSS